MHHALAHTTACATVCTRHFVSCEDTFLEFGTIADCIASLADAGDHGSAAMRADPCVRFRLAALLRA